MDMKIIVILLLKLYHNFIAVMKTDEMLKHLIIMHDWWTDTPTEMFGEQWTGDWKSYCRLFFSHFIAAFAILFNIQSNIYAYKEVMYFVMM